MELRRSNLQINLAGNQVSSREGVGGGGWEEVVVMEIPGWGKSILKELQGVEPNKEGTTKGSGPREGQGTLVLSAFPGHPQS